MILGIIKLLLGLIVDALPVFWELKEKSHEAVEAERDHDLDREFWSSEWMS